MNVLRDSTRATRVQGVSTPMEDSDVNVIRNNVN